MEKNRLKEKTHRNHQLVVVIIPSTPLARVLPGLVAHAVLLEPPIAPKVLAPVSPIPAVAIARVHVHTDAVRPSAASPALLPAHARVEVVHPEAHRVPAHVVHLHLRGIAAVRFIKVHLQLALRSVPPVVAPALVVEHTVPMPRADVLIVLVLTEADGLRGLVAVIPCPVRLAVAYVLVDAVAVVAAYSLVRGMNPETRGQRRRPALGPAPVLVAVAGVRPEAGPVP